MIGTFVFDGVLILHAAWGKISFKANNGFNTLFFGSFEKIQGSKHGAMIGQCQGRHAQLLGPFYKIDRCAETIKDGVSRVDMQMHK